MRDRQGRDEMIPLLLTGHQTSATAPSWAWYLLSLHLDVERTWHLDLA
jgi:cytochrome P450